MAQGVRCMVNNCSFWNNNKCGAPEIEIKTSKEHMAHDSKETNCATFLM